MSCQRNIGVNTEEQMIKFYTGDIIPDKNTVFVFGSNPLGINGNPYKGTGGAALVAVQNFGVGLHEIMNNCLSSSGSAYGLVTVSAPGMKRSLTKDEIINNIRILYHTARCLPNKDFKVAYRNTSRCSLNGYTGYEMMEMFLVAGDIPENIWFSEEWINSYIFKNKFKSVELI